jgi:LPS sulfotransferase NodH
MGADAVTPLERAFPASSVLRASTVTALKRQSTLYVMFIIARSGSTWLTDMAMRGGRLGAPQEWFNDEWIQGAEPALGCKPPRLAGTGDINEYATRCVADHRSTIGLMGVQLSYHQTLGLMRAMEDPAAAATLPLFYLRRRNILAQAISLYKSVESGLFHSYQNTGKNTVFTAPAYDQQKIALWLGHLVDCEAGFAALFASCGAAPVALFYEDMVARPAEYLAMIEHRITGHTPPAAVAPASPLRQLGDAQSLAWEERFRREAAPLLRDIENRRPDVSSAP